MYSLTVAVKLKVLSPRLFNFGVRLMKPLMKLFIVTLLFSAGIAQTPLRGFASTVEVDSRSNIFAAGRSTVPDFPGGGGVLPPEFDLPVGIGRSLSFPSVTGLIDSAGGTPMWGPDGRGSHSTDINSFDGISGIRVSGTQLFLAGVFLDDSSPSGDTAPPRLEFNSPVDFTELSPVLNQTFFIGDGLTGTGSGTVQQFNAPDDATRFYLGIHDAGFATGDPGAYEDNTGSFTVTIDGIFELSGPPFGGPPFEPPGPPFELPGPPFGPPGPPFELPGPPPATPPFDMLLGPPGASVLAVPEPSTLSLAAIGFIVLFGYARRRKRWPT